MEKPEKANKVRQKDVDSWWTKKNNKLHCFKVNYILKSLFFLLASDFPKSLLVIPVDISDDMSIKIYVRGRQKVSDGVHKPKYRIVAIVSDEEKKSSIKVNAAHFRKKELEQIASDIHAEIVYLKSEADGKHSHRK